MDLETFRSDSLKAHNAYRKVHGAEPLQETQNLNDYAQKWANHLANTLQFRHSYGDYGENIAYKMQSNVPTGYEITKMWYSEEKDYNYDTQRAKRPGAVIGHFTQVVWKDTQFVGFGLANNGRKYYAVASYDDPGNYTGKYRENVERKTGEPDFSEPEGEEAEEESVEEDDDDDDDEDGGDEDEKKEEEGEEEENEKDKEGDENVLRNRRGNKKPNQLPRPVVKAFRRRFMRQVNRFRDNQGMPSLRRDTLYQKLAQKSANAMVKSKRKHHDEPRKILHWTMPLLQTGDEAARNLRRGAKASDEKATELFGYLLSNDFNAIGVGVSCPNQHGDEESFVFVYLG